MDDKPLSPHDLEAGIVVSIHGVAGGIKVKAHSGDPGGLLGARTLRIVLKRAGGVPESHVHKVKSARRSGGCAVFSLEGVDTAQAAERLLGASVSVSRNELPSLEEGEFFVADLVGCVVEADGAGIIGRVADVVTGPAHDWLSIRLSGRSAEALLPLVSRFVRDVDIPGHRVFVTPPEGWPDEV